MDCSLPGSSVHGVSQAKILEWVAISSSRGSYQPRDRTYVSCIGRQILYHWATGEAPKSTPRSFRTQVFCFTWCYDTFHETKMNSVDSSVNGAYGESQPEFCVHKRGQVFTQSFLRKSTSQLMLSEGTVALYQESRTGKQKLSYLSFAPHMHAYKCIRASAKLREKYRAFFNLFVFNIVRHKLSGL